MKRLIFVLLAFVFLTNTSFAFAHPGRTASDGCHYCRTNCDKWGVAWNERHCHGGGAVSSTSEKIDSATNKSDSFWTLLAVGGLGFGGYQWLKNRGKDK
jgi:hypothetical protein